MISQVQERLKAGPDQLQCVLERQVRQLAGGVLSQPGRSIARSLDRSAEADTGVKGLRRLGPDDGRATTGLTWSPDGTKLAFTHGDGDYEVFVMDADGTGLKNLTDNEKISDGSPSWSPDGEAIAFVSDRVEKLNQVFAMRADGSDQTQLTDDRRGSPRWNDIDWAAWSPAGA